MWSYLPIGTLIDFQRRTAFQEMGQQARKFLADGYSVEADRVLDKMCERRRLWEAPDAP